MKYIIAGNYKQFREYLEKHKIRSKDVMYISKHGLKGRTITEDDEIIRIGTFYERGDLHEIERELLLCQKKAVQGR